MPLLPAPSCPSPESCSAFLFFNLFMAALGLRCCVWAFSHCGKWGLLFIVVLRLLITVASLCCRVQAVGTQAPVVAAWGLSN